MPLHILYIEVSKIKFIVKGLGFPVIEGRVIQAMKKIRARLSRKKYAIQ